MDALRLIKTARHALAEARSVPDVLQEAWQAAMLTEALAGRLGEHPVAEVVMLAQLLAEAGGHAGGCLEVPGGQPDHGDFSPTGRAARLSEIGEPVTVLRQLRHLLDEASEALIIVACGAQTESVYWQCIDGVDAYSECRDLVAELIRALRHLDGEPEPTGPDHPQPRPEPGPAKAKSTLLLPLEPPTVAVRATQPPVLPSPADGGPATGSSPTRRRRRYRAPEPAEASGDPLRSVVREPEDRRSAFSPARSAFTDASSSCICSNRVLGAAAGTAGEAGFFSRGATGTSYLGSDMRGTLQLGGAM